MGIGIEIEVIFLKVLSMGIAASWVIAAVVVMRFCLKRTPKWIICILWALAALRLVCPVMPESSWSLIPRAVGNGEMLLGRTDGRMSDHADGRMDERAEGRMGDRAGDVAGLNKDFQDSSETMEVVPKEIPAGEGEGHAVPVGSGTWQPQTILAAAVPVLARIWLLGAALMLIYAGYGYLRLFRMVQEKVPMTDGEERIFFCDTLKSPFILGMLRPGIFLPSDMEADSVELVLAHEEAHLKRLDHIWKPIGFLILSLHWFNPFCWFAYALFCRDIELACDEKVIRRMDLEERKAYSNALLACSMRDRLVTACPLAFGEIGVKERIQNVLQYKKPAFWIIAGTGVVCVWVAVSFLTDPPAQPSEAPVYLSGGAAGAAPGDEGAVYPEVDIAAEMEKAEKKTDAETIENVEKPAEEEIEKTVEKTEAGAESAEKDGGEQPDSLDAAIEKAVLDRFGGGFESHVILAKETTESASVAGGNAGKNADEDAGTNAGSGKAETVTVYASVLYMGFLFKDDGIKDDRGAHIPTALTFDVTEDGRYILTEYWEPRDGAYYAGDIREKFPKKAVSDAMDTQKYVLALTQACYAQAIAAGNVNTDHAVERLLDRIMSSPAQASNPADYIDAHSLDYRELTYYGDYALRYCFGEFLKGDQTDLRGSVMRILMDNLAPELKLRLHTKNGQEYFDAVLKAAEKTYAQKGEQWMRENMPHGWMLCRMKAE